MTHPNDFVRRHRAAIGPNIKRLILSSTFRYFELTCSSARVSISGSLSRPCSTVRSCHILSGPTLPEGQGQDQSSAARSELSMTV